MAENQGPKVLLTHEQVEQWKLEFAQTTIEVQRLLERQQYLRSKLQAVDDLLGSNHLPPVKALDVLYPSNSSVVFGRIDGKPRLTFKTLSGGRIGDELVGDSLGDDDQESMVNAVSRILEETKYPLTHDYIREELSKTPKFASSLQSNPNYYYTVMSRLVSRGQAIKSGKLYMAPSVIGLSSDRTEEDQDPAD